MVKGLATAVGIFVFVAAAAGTASAQSKCTGGKDKAAGKKASCKLGVYAKARSKNLPVDTAKLAGCEVKYDAAWAKAESAMDCNAPTGDHDAIEGKVDTFVTNEDNDLTNNGSNTLPSKCIGSKEKAAGKKASCKLGVYAKAASKNLPVDTAKLAGCEAKWDAAAVKADGAGDCGTMPSNATIEGDVDAFVTDVNGELSPPQSPQCAPIVVGQPIPGTYVLNGDSGEPRCTTNSSTNRFGTCTDDAQCGGTAGMHNMCLQLPWVTADGQIMPFPTAVQTVFTVAAADSFPTCEHDVCVPCGNPNAACGGIPGCAVAGNPNGCIPRATQGCCDQPGFIVPTFFVNILGGLCSRVDQIACGIGVVNTSKPQSGDNEVTKNADTSDPGADCTYGTADDCSSSTAGGAICTGCPGATCVACTLAGQGNDYKGKIVSTIGNGSADADGIHYRLTTPELSTTWTDSQSPSGTCANGSKYDDGELLVSQLILQAQPTTAGATGSFVDMNGDGCARAGAGFIAATNPSTNGPITVGPAPGPLRPQPYDGSAGAVSAAVSEVFSGPNSPIRDIGFVAITPQKPIATHSAVSCSCTPVAGCPE